MVRLVLGQRDSQMKQLKVTVWLSTISKTHTLKSTSIYPDTKEQLHREKKNIRIIYDNKINEIETDTNQRQPLHNVILI